MGVPRNNPDGMKPLSDDFSLRLATVAHNGILVAA